jgi:hypothetical protein
MTRAGDEPEFLRICCLGLLAERILDSVMDLSSAARLALPDGFGKSATELQYPLTCM